MGYGRSRQAWVQVRTDGRQTARVEVNGQPLRIGRAPGNSIVLQDQFVSARHAEVIEHQGTRAVRDLGSSNGTLLNGRPLAPGTLHALRDGDVLQIGASELTYHGGPADTAACRASGSAGCSANRATPGSATDAATRRDAGRDDRATRDGAARRTSTVPPVTAPPPASAPTRANSATLLLAGGATGAGRLLLVLALVATLVAGGAWLLAPSRVVLLVLGQRRSP